MSKLDPKKMVQVALLVAIEVILTRFCSVNTPIVRIGFGFLPIALTGMLYGPVWAACGATMGDILGALLFPTGAFFPGFTLSACLTGLTFGFLLHGKFGWWRTVLAAGVVCVGINLCLDTFWLHLLMGQGYLALLPTRILKCVIMAPIQVALIQFVTSRRHLLRDMGEVGRKA